MNRITVNSDHTVLSLACAGGHLAVVELLLAHGADPTQRLKVSGIFLLCVCCCAVFVVVSGKSGSAVGNPAKS